MSEKIEPALSESEWADARAQEFRAFGGVVDWNIGWIDCHEADFDRPMAFAMIALANARIPDGDPRKITRKRITAMRRCAELMQSRADSPHLLLDDRNLASFDAGWCREMADALESYLPPEKNG